MGNANANNMFMLTKTQSIKFIVNVRHGCPVARVRGSCLKHKTIKLSMSKQTQKMHATYKQEHERAKLETTKVNCIGGHLKNACQTIFYTIGNLSFCCV